jgi:hypothetical protein
MTMNPIELRKLLVPWFLLLVLCIVVAFVFLMYSDRAPYEPPSTPPSTQDEPVRDVANPEIPPHDPSAYRVYDPFPGSFCLG